MRRKRKEERMIEYRNILYCTDFSEEADMAFVNAVDLAQKHGARLHILHVIHSPYHIRRDIVDEYVSEASSDKMSSAVLEKAREDLERKYVPRLGDVKDYELATLEGVPFVEIIRFARKKNIDVIVMGAMGKSEIDRQSFGSTVENVARRAHCHVMAVRNPEAAFKLPG
jgi:nucleotide-binding universal stress UspA family protein